ncbi:MAG: hypothetical protein GY749_44775 [Desulfobacteraceae bacterium]|nr:hypothetical protein [Desulfobacteraceae bacterium]
MTQEGRKFKISHFESFEEIIQTSEYLSGYPLEIKDRYSNNSIWLQFEDIPGEVCVSFDGKNNLCLKAIPGEAPVLMDLLTLSLSKSGAEYAYDMPDLKLPLTKQQIIENNEKVSRELNKNISQAMIGCLFAVTAIILLIVLFVILMLS